MQAMVMLCETQKAVSYTHLDVYKRQFKDKEHRINLAGKSKQELLDILFEERGYEFMDEMQRWFDRCV